MAFNITSNGTYNLGLLSLNGTSATVDPGLTGVTIDLTGALTTFHISSNTGSVVTVNNTVNALSTVDLDTNGGAIILTSTVSALGPANVKIDGGGSFSVGSTFVGLLNSGSVTFSTGGGTAILGTANDFINISFAPVFDDYTPGTTDTIDDASFDYSKLTGYTVTGPDKNTGDQTITLSGSAGSGSFSFTVHPITPIPQGTYTSTTGPLAFTNDGNGGTDIVCFLRGTRIATAAGERAVEDLRSGDFAVTADGSHSVIKWIGHRSLDLRRIRNPDMFYPVRIRQDAFAPNIPHRDLLITQDHCVFLNGGLIPARMLVNDRSIILDRSIEQFTYYHVELEQHDILLAENLPAESYLDTGNRGNFANAATAALRPDLTVNASHQNWTHAAAPLTVHQAAVEPVWRRLDARARQLGLPRLSAEPELTDQPDLRVVTGNGAVIRPVRHANGRYLFMLKAGDTDLRLLSNTARPSETFGPFIDDRRELGVLVGEIAFYVGRRKLRLDGHLTAPDLQGWFGVESDSHRWTNGDAKLPAPARRSAGRGVILEIQVIHAGPYKVAAEVMKTAIAA